MPRPHRPSQQLISRVTFDPQHCDPVLSPEALAFGESRGWLNPGGTRSHDPVVYYMRMDRLVKIGTTIDIIRRMENVMPQGLMAVEYGGRDIERERHRQFAEHHSHGEWYWMSEPLGLHIADLRERWEAIEALTIEDWLARRKLTNG